MPMENLNGTPEPKECWLLKPGEGTAGAAAEDGAPLALDPLAGETLILNLEASLRVFNERHLFAWTQGLLQGIVSHQVLICRLRRQENGGAPDLISYSTDEAGPDSVEALCRLDRGFSDALLQAWQAGHCRALLQDIEALPEMDASPLQQRLLGMGLQRLVGHGVLDASGQAAGFYVFAGTRDSLGRAHLHRIELLVPLLHAALLRTRISPEGTGAEPGNGAGGREFLTEREQEVLRWMYLGKSNVEIGMILGISPLTVKNHVQAILRRLDVQNRAQAVGKAFKLRILSC